MALRGKWILAIVIMILVVVCAEWLENHIHKSSIKHRIQQIKIINKQR